MSLLEDDAEGATWLALCREAHLLLRREPALATMIHAAVLAQDDLVTALATQVANRLADDDIDPLTLRSLALAAYAADPGLVTHCEGDLLAVRERDPANAGPLQTFLFFKGFQALQAQRLANHLWRVGRQSLALQLQSRIAQVFDVSIHPAVSLGAGLFIDHGTGIVIGETATIGDRVSMLQGVTLGAGEALGAVRHPQIEEGATLNAAATLLGPITVGAWAKIGAGALVLESVPPHCTAVGTPARLVNCLREQLGF